MEDEIEVSIVIPNLNSPIIDKTIASVKNQSYDPHKIEIIVVGQDRFGLIKEDERVKFIQTEYKATCGKATDIGCRHASGKVLFFTDADCVAEKDWVKELIKWHKRGFQVVGGSVRIDFKGANFWSLSDNIGSFYFLLPDNPEGVLGKGCIIGHGNFSISKELYFEIGGFTEDEEYYPDDADLNARLRKRGYDIYFQPKAIVCHHNLRNSFKSLLNHAIRYGRFFTRLMEKHPGYFTKRNTLYTHSNRILLLISSPLKALVDTCSIFRRHEMLRKYWYTFGGVLLFRFFIYYSISKALRKKSKQTLKINHG